MCLTCDTDSLNRTKLGLKLVSLSVFCETVNGLNRTKLGLKRAAIVRVRLASALVLIEPSWD